MKQVRALIDNFLVTSQHVLVLFILIAVGFLCGKKGLINDISSKGMTDVVLYAVTPCVMISAFQRDYTAELIGNILITALCALGIMTMTIIISLLVFRDKDEGRKKVLQFSAIFSNCGFMSLPLQKALLGDDGWFYGSIFVAMFNLIVWSYGLVMMSGDKKQLSAKKLITNPGIVGVVVAMLLFVCSIRLPGIISAPVDYLAALNTPLPMLIIGYHLSKAKLRKAFTDIGAYISIALRIIVVPVISAVVMILLHIDNTILITCLIASSAPTAATTTMFATKFNRDTELSVSIVSASTIFSIFTMPLIVAVAQTVIG